MHKTLPHPASLQSADFSLLVDAAALRHPVLGLGRAALRKIVARILEAAHLQSLVAESEGLELHITSDQVITDLHRRYLGGAGPTNVLSFPGNPRYTQDSGASLTADFLRADFPRPVLGSIVISADAVHREAFLYGQDPQDHLIRLLTHALLHLAGHHHGEIMDAVTEQVLDQLRTDLDPPL